MRLIIVFPFSGLPECAIGQALGILTPTLIWGLLLDQSF
jgi:hypothetical protein